VVLLSIHWVNDRDHGNPVPGERHRELARRFVREAGIDGLVGTGTHHLHGVEVIDGRPVIYDAGDLVLDWGGSGWMHKSALFRLEVNRSGVRRVEVLPIRLGSSRCSMAKGEDKEDILSRIDVLSRPFGTGFEVERDRAVLKIEPVYVPEEPREVFGEGPRKAELPTANSYPSAVLVDRLADDIEMHNIRFENGIELLGSNIGASAKDGYGVPVVTYWRTTAKVAASYEIYLAVKNLTNKSVRPWRGDHQPGDYMYPTQWWNPGEIVRDSYFMRPHPKTKPGKHVFKFGLIRNKKRVKIVAPEHLAGQTEFDVGVVLIK
jgi:hypothetical protein